MSGAHCTEQKLEGVWCHSLRAPSILTLLQEYQQILQRLLGPKAGTTLVHHSGGLDSFVNSSSELVKRIQPHHPSLKFINCLMEAQNSAYGCLGLYVGVLCLSLLKELLQLEVNFNEGLSQRTVKEATNLLMAQIIAYLDTKPDNFVDKLDLSNLDQMLALVGTTLGSKNFGLNCQEKQHLKVKIVEAFLAAIPSNNDKELDAFGDVTVTVMEGQSATEAQVFEGVLYREPDPNETVINAIKQRMKDGHHTHTSNRLVLKEKKTINANQDELLSNKNTCRIQNSLESSNNALRSVYSAHVSNRLAVSKYSRNILEDNENYTCNTPHAIHPPSCLRMVLFNVPLVFEQSETECLKFTGGAPNSEVYDTVMVAKLRDLVRRCRVVVIACQKVISDVIKFELQRDGVLVLERLGTTLTDSLQRLTGCVAISDVAGFLSPPNIVLDEIDTSETNKFNPRDVDEFCDGFVGSLTDIHVVEVSGNTYLQLENSRRRTKPDKVNNHMTKGLIDKGIVTKGSPVVTFLLPALTSVTSESLKAVVEESLRVLRHAAIHPLVAAAGGCFEAALSHWTTLGRVVATDEEMTNGHVDGQSFLPADTPLTSSSETKSETVEGVLGVDEVLAAVDRLLEENDTVEDAVSELQLRQVACVFAKVFANLSVLLSGGTSASSFDFSTDTRTSHLIPDVTPDLSCPGHSSSSAEGQSCLVKCSCRSTVSTFSSNSKATGFVNLRSLFEHHPGLSQLPSHSSTKNSDFENPNAFSSKNVFAKVVSSSSDTMKTLDINGAHSLEELPGEHVPPRYVYEVTADCLVESYHAKVNAIRLAFEGVVQLLCVDYCVFDR